MKRKLVSIIVIIFQCILFSSFLRAQEQTDSHKAEEYIFMAQQALEKNELDNAVTFAEKAIELNPDNDTAHHVYARWHRKVATLSGIAKTFAKVLYGGLPPASLEKAEEHFQKAIALKPDHINHHLELGITYEMMEEWQKADAAYDKVAALEAKNNMDQKYKAEAASRKADIAKKL